MALFLKMWRWSQNHWVVWNARGKDVWAEFCHHQFWWCCRWRVFVLWCEAPSFLPSFLQSVFSSSSFHYQHCGCFSSPLSNVEKADDAWEGRFEERREKSSRVGLEKVVWLLWNLERVQGGTMFIVWLWKKLTCTLRWSYCLVHGCTSVSGLPTLNTNANKSHTTSLTEFEAWSGETGENGAEMDGDRDILPIWDSVGCIGGDVVKTFNFARKLLPGLGQVPNLAELNHWISVNFAVGKVLCSACQWHLYSFRFLPVPPHHFHHPFPTFRNKASIRHNVVP